MKVEKIILLDTIVVRIEAINFKKNFAKKQNYLRVKVAMLDENEDTRGYLFYTIEKINPQNSIAHHLANAIAGNYMDIPLDEFIHFALGKKLYANLVGFECEGKNYISTLCFPQPEWLENIPAWDFSFEGEQNEECDCEVDEKLLMIDSGWCI